MWQFFSTRSRKSEASPAAPARQEPSDALLRRLEWEVLKPLQGLMPGDRTTRQTGGGLDLSDIRVYQPHDEVRHIDWNVTARQQQAHVRVFRQEREMATWFLVDATASVGFGSADQRKLDMVRGLVAVLGRMFHLHGDRIGAGIYRGGRPGNGGVEWLPASGGRRQMLQILDRMAVVPAAASRSEKHCKAPEDAGQPRDTQLAAWLNAAAGVIRSPSSVIVASDFIGETGWETALARLAQRHDVLAVWVRDPLEIALPDLGILTLEDAETGERLVVDTADAGFRRRFSAMATERESALRAALARSGATSLELSTDDSLADVVMRYIEQRRHHKRLGHAKLHKRVASAQPEVMPVESPNPLATPKEALA